MAVFIALFALDLIAYYCFASGNYGRQLPYALNVWSGFAVGQMSLIAIWLAFRRKHDLASWFVPPLGLVAASYIRMQLRFLGGFTFLDYVCRNTLQALFSLVVLWPLIRTPAWRKISRDTAGLQFGYSFKHLLLWMTSTAILAMLIGRATWQNGSPLAMTLWLGLLAPGLVAIVIVIAHQFPLPWPVRIVIYFGVGLLVGYALALLGNRRIQDLLMVEFLAQAGVVALGVELGKVTASQNEPLEGQ